MSSSPSTAPPGSADAPNANAPKHSSRSPIQTTATPSRTEPTSSLKETPMTVHYSRGRYYEEMVTGDVFKHEPGRTITEADNVLFSNMTLNSQSLHLDA